ncbi:MAG: chromate transporter, partial [Anaeromyxobacteraceae bacterium]
FFLVRLPFPAVLIGCGLAFVAWRRARGAVGATAAAAALAFAGRAEAVAPAASRALDVSWFFLKVGLFSFGGAYAVLPYIREGAVATYGWMSDRQMIDALALGETTPGPLISIGIFVGFLAGNGAGAPWLGATAATFWLFLPSFVFVLAAAPSMNWLTSRPGLKEFLRGITSGVVGLMFSIAIPLARVAFMRDGRVDAVTLALGLAAFLVLTFWKWRLNVVVVVLAGGALGLVRAFLPALFGGPLS